MDVSVEKVKLDVLGLAEKCFYSRKGGWCTWLC